MAIDQTTLSEEQPSPDVLRLLGGLESGEFYVPDESPYAGDWTDFGRMRRDRQRRKKFQEFDRKGGSYATLPQHWTQNLLPDLQDMRSLWTFGSGGGDMAMELAGLTPGGKAGIMALGAIRNNPKIIRNMPKSVYNKHKTALETGKGGSRMGLDYFSHMDPTFALERILAPALGSLKKARKYEYAITSEGKHYFKHKVTNKYKVIPATRQEITKPQSLMMPDKRKKKVFKRRQDDVKKADWVKARKQRLQVDDAADDLFQLRSRDIPDEVRAVTLERYQQYPEAVKLEAMKLLDIGGPAGGAGAGLPSLLNPAKFAANRAKVAGETGEKTVILYHRGPKGIDELKLAPDKAGQNKNALFFYNKPFKGGFGDTLYKVEARVPAGSSVKLGNPSKELIKNLDIAIAKAMEPYAALVKQGGAQPFEVEVLRELRGILKGNKYFGGTKESRALMRQQGHVRSLDPVQQEFLLSQGVKHLDGLSQFGDKISIVLDPDILKIVK